jgi:SAM-dependent methyltransferase
MSHAGQPAGWIWTEYWAGGRQSCFEDAPPKARQCLESIWRRYTETLCQGTRILDLATGAGDVARLLLQQGFDTSLNFEIVGVDLAAIQPPQHMPDSPSLFRLVGNVDLLHLPFPGRSFDSVVSQFGVEYADVGKAAVETARVLTPAGTGLFVVHHAASAFTLAARERMAVFADVVGDGRAFDQGERMFKLCAARGQGRELEAAVAQFRDGVQRMRHALSRRGGPEQNVGEVVAFLSDLARAPMQFDPVDALRKLSGARTAILAWTLRQQCQLAAARDEPAMADVVRGMAAVGLATTGLAEVRDGDGTVLAWKLTFEKAAQ